MNSTRKKTKSLKTLSKSSNNIETNTLNKTSKISPLFYKSFCHLQSFVYSLKLQMLLYVVRLKNSIPFDLLAGKKYNQARFYWILLWLFYVFPYFQMINQLEIFRYRAFSLMSFFRFVFYEDNFFHNNGTKNISINNEKQIETVVEFKRSKKSRRKFFNKPNENQRNFNQELKKNYEG